MRLQKVTKRSVIVKVLLKVFFFKFLMCVISFDGLEVRVPHCCVGVSDRNTGPAKNTSDAASCSMCRRIIHRFCCAGGPDVIF